MEEVWVVYLCLILIVIMLVLMKQKPQVEEARKERESKVSLPSSHFSSSNVGRQLEHAQEELDKYLERLKQVVQATVDTDLDERRHQRQSASRRYRERYHPEAAAQPETDTA